MPNGHETFLIEGGVLLLRAPWGGNVSLVIPTFRGGAATEEFIVQQKLAWTLGEADGRPAADFALEGDEAAVGIRFGGRVVARGPDEFVIDLRLTNAASVPLQMGRHILFLGLGDQPGFADAEGRQTVFYTDGGWRPRRLLTFKGQPLPPHGAVRVGTHYDDVSVIWDLIVRINEKRDAIVGFGLDRSFAFSADHPEWGVGLLAALRWSALDPGETQEARGAVYLLRTNFADLEARYQRNRRRA